MRIIGFAQTMRLGSTAEEGYVLNIQLDDGTEAAIPTDQSTVLALTKLWAENRKSLVPASNKKVLVPRSMEDDAPFMPPPPAAEEDDGVDEGEVFGGDVPVNSAYKVQVASDEMGYPVVKAVPQKVAVQAPLPAMPRPRFLEDDEDGKQV
jgi:hypothetical protein